MAKQRNKLSNWAEYVLAAGLMAALRWLPRPLAARFARTAAGLLDKLLPRLRRVGRTNLSFALPDLSEKERERIIDGVFASIGRLLLSFARFPALNEGNIHEWIEYEGLDHYQAAKMTGKGVLVATAHLGNWELSAFTHGLLTEPMHIMVRPLDNPLIDHIVESRRSMSGNKLISKRESARAVLRALHSNEAVGVLIDQNTTPGEGVFIHFFGKQACAGTGFVKLALHSGAPVAPGFALWDEKRAKYVLRFYPAIPLSGDVHRDTQSIHLFLEQVIRQYPDQWMWIHRRWKTRPANEVKLY